MYELTRRRKNRQQTTKRRHGEPDVGRRARLPYRRVSRRTRMGCLDLETTGGAAIDAMVGWTVETGSRSGRSEGNKRRIY